jgi:putative methionine-R-sulfoxide reductase with GAF domain
VVVPCLGPDGHAWAVLDLDSHQVGSFGASDAEALTALLRQAGLSA